jgi:hypothetical protein
MKFYHYTNAAGYSGIRRLKAHGWEFLESEQNQSEGKPKACYLSQKSPLELAEVSKPVARYLGLKATQGDVWYCFELDLPDEWFNPRNRGGVPVVIKPIKGERGTMGIALYMTKGGTYDAYLGSAGSEDVVKREDYLFILKAYCTQVWTIGTGVSDRNPKVVE